MTNNNRRDLPLSFRAGFVESRNVARVIAQIDELADQGSTRSILMKWSGGRWNHFAIEWIATRMWMQNQPELQLFATGPEGRVLVATSQASFEEDIDTSPTGPPLRGHIRDLRGIGQGLYACGMSRQVYKREGRGRWARRDQGVVLPLGTLAVAGFNSIDGQNEDDFYAVGYGGEIWQCANGEWHQIDSPTNVILHRVRVIDSNLAYAAGQNGTLLSGIGDKWKEIAHGATEENLWGMEWFKEALYVASESAVFRLTSTGDLEPTSTKVLDYCGHLHASDGTMWSFGTKQVAWTEDGKTWHDVTP